MLANHQQSDQEIALQNWIHKNWKTIILFITATCIMIVSYQFYTKHQYNNIQNSSALYENALNAMRNNEFNKVTSLANQTIKQYPKTQYAALSSLLLAKIETDKHAYPAAIKHLLWFNENNHDKLLNDIVKQRIARIYLSLKQPENVLKVTSTIQQKKHLIYKELLAGDAYKLQKKYPQARQSYNNALLRLNTYSQQDANTILYPCAKY